MLTVVKLVSMHALSSGTLLFFKHLGLSLLLLNALSKTLRLQQQPDVYAWAIGNCLGYKEITVRAVGSQSPYG